MKGEGKGDGEGEGKAVGRTAGRRREGDARDKEEKGTTGRCSSERGTRLNLGQGSGLRGQGRCHYRARGSALRDLQETK